ncbi:MAG: hypothetical protein GOVbin1629_25 [Prokaryotic dsDNA virus sp.]|nr:MAG: hypothetical protein GOVbin1629_25 [Prokaryotic dsDNA virus sp.]
MPPISPDDRQSISHITFLADSIHDFGDQIYEHLMDRENQEAKEKAQELIEKLADLIQSLSDEI